MIPHRDKWQPTQNTGDGHQIGDWTWLWLIQLLCAALASLPPPLQGAPELQKVDILRHRFGKFLKFDDCL